VYQDTDRDHSHIIQGVPGYRQEILHTLSEVYQDTGRDPSHIYRSGIGFKNKQVFGTIAIHEDTNKEHFYKILVVFLYKRSCCSSQKLLSSCSKQK